MALDIFFITRLDFIIKYPISHTNCWIVIAFEHFFLIFQKLYVVYCALIFPFGLSCSQVYSDDASGFLFTASLLKNT